MLALSRVLALLLSATLLAGCPSSEADFDEGNGRSNVAPSITSTAPTSATEDVAYSYQLEVVDPDDENDGSSLKFRLLTAPSGMTVSNTGLIQWTPTDGVSTASVKVAVADGGERGAKPDTQTFNIVVTPVNDAPVITSAAATSAITGYPYSYQVAVSDPDDANNGTDLRFDLMTAPAGMTISSTGLLSWTPPLAGVTESVRVRVRDGGENGAAAAIQNFSISVSAGNSAPVITSTPSVTATENILYQYQLAVTDAEDVNNGADLTFSFISAPTGMTISPTGLIEWTPTENGAMPWSENVEVQVADGGEDGVGPDSQAFTINVMPVNNAPTISSAAPASAIEASLYSYQVIVVDSDDDNNGSDLTYTLTDAPAGMTVSATGLITWTPAGGLTTANVSLRVDDGGEDGAAPAIQNWAISIDGVNDAPVISSTALTVAAEGVEYQYQVVVNDPDDQNNGTDLTFSLLTAPSGMTVSSTGLITWTPGENGAADWTENVELQVADGGENGVSPVTQSWTIDVTAVNSPPVFTEVSPQQVNISEDGAPTPFALNLNVTDADSASDEMVWSISTAAANGVATATGDGYSKDINYVPNADFSGTDSFVVSVSDGELSTTLTVDVLVTAANDAPSITSVAPTVASEGVLYQYAVQVSDSDDANNGTDLTFSLLAAPSGMTVSSTGLIQWTPDFGTTSGDVTVQVVDGGEDGAAAATQSWTIAVTDVNQPPEITEGESVSVSMSEDSTPVPFALTLNATDPDAAATLAWSVSSAAANGVAAVSPSGGSVTVSYAPALNFSGNDSFVVTVSDGEFGDTITVNVSVVSENDAPAITSVPVLTATEDQPYQYNMTATDLDGPSTQWSLIAAPSGMSIDAASGVISWTPDEVGVTPTLVDVTAQYSDGILNDQQSFQILVTPVNDAPVITSTAVTSASEASVYQYTVTVSDSDDANNGTDLTFTLTQMPAGMTVSPTGVITWTPPNGVSSADITVQVSDGGEDGAVAATQSWTILVGDINDAPTITSTAITAATESSAYSYQVIVNDPDDANNGSDLTFSLLASPSGMAVSPTGLITWTPAENGAAPWQANVQLQVADGGENGAAAAIQNWTIDVTPVNNAPIITQGDSVSVSMSEDASPTPFALAIDATDADSATLTWTLNSAASNGVAAASGTGSSPTISYIPSANYVGSDSFVVRVSDGDLFDDITVNVNVGAENDAPTISSTAITAATEGQLYQYAATVSDSDGPSATWSLTQAPTGMTVDGTSGLVSWTPGEGGATTWTADVTLQVSDGTDVATQTFVVSVTPFNNAPTITSSPATSAVEDELYQYQIVVTDTDDANNGSDINFALTTAPAGMTVSSTGLIEWTPTVGGVSEDVVVSVTDGGEDGAAAATQSWTISVNDTNDAPIITSVAPTTATEDDTYSYQVDVTDADDANNGTDLTFSLPIAPAGMTVSTTGLITWTPANGVTSENVTVRVADGGESGALPAEQSWTITVASVNDAPVITEGDSVDVNMSEDSTPTPFALTLNATDIDSATLTWTIQSAATNGTASVSGSGLSKTISYTPNADYSGADSFVVRVSDGDLFDDITVNVNVGAQNDAPTISSAAVTAATEGQLYQYAATVSDSDGPSATWSLTQAPAGMTVDGASGLVSWTPGEGGATTWTADVTLQVSDGTDSATQTFVVSVTPFNNAPTITSSPATSAVEDEAYQYQIVVADTDDTNNGSDIGFALTTAPAGMTVSSTGLIEWTPTVGGVSENVAISVTDGGENGAAAATQNWTVTVTDTNDAPVITSAAPTTATEDVQYSYQVQVTDADDANNGTDLTFSLPIAPAGMTVSTTGLITWTPANGVTSENVTVRVADGGEGGALPAEQSWTITVASVNDAPVITEGDSVDVNMSEDSTPTPFALTLNATDIDSATLTWTIQSAATNGTASVSGSGLSKTISYTPNADYSGADSFVVRVSDGDLFDDITVNVNVGAQNDAPTISSAAVTAATEGQLYQYAATVSDSDGPSATWSLTQAPAGMTVDGASGLVSWTPGEGGATTWTADVTLQVSDGTDSATQTFVVSVTPFNNAPTITSSPATSAVEDEAYQYQIVVADTDDTNNGSDIGFALTTAPAGMTVSSTGLIEWTPTVGGVSENVAISVTDGGENGAAAATQNWTVTVTDTNDAPVITSAAPTTATEDVQYSYQVQVTDADDANNGTDLTFSLPIAPAGMTVSTTGLITWTPANGVTSENVTVRVADGGEGGALPAEQSWTISVTGENDAPVITEGSTASVTMSEDSAPTPFALTLNATDVDSATLTWTIQSAASSGTANASGTGFSKAISYTPNADYSGTDNFVVRVSDGVAFADIAIAVTIEAVNDAPTITSSAVLTASEDVLYQYQAQSADVDGPSATWSLLTAPAGMSVAPSTGLVQWTPAENGADVWTANVSLRVTDGDQSAQQDFVISVTPENNAPVITEGASVSVTMSEDSTPTPFALTLNATDSDSATLTWSVFTDATSGTATASAGGLSSVIGYTPAANFNGSDSFVIRVSDGLLSDDILVNVDVEAANDAPVFTSTAILTATEDQAYQYAATATDADAETLTWSLTTSPSGMTIDAAGVINWTPGEVGASGASENVVVAVSDGTDSVTQSFAIAVAPMNDAPTITSSAPTSGTEGALYQYALAVTDPDDANNGTDLTFALTQSPAGMTISPTGVITWTPPNGVASADVSVSVTDGGEDGAAQATQSWTISVGDVNDAPTITSSAPTTATESAAYSYQVVVNDPDDANNGADLTFSLLASPSGMSISATGLIAWTPGENGAAVWQANVQVQVADGGENGAAAATQSWTIDVTPVNNAPTIDQGETAAVTMSEDGTPTPFTLLLSATDADSATLTWSISSAAANGAASASGTGNSKNISYIPTANFSGNDSFVVSVSDGEFTDEITVNVTVEDQNDAPEITSVAPTAATEDVLYQYSAQVTDIDGPSATWSLTQAPAGMTVSAGGVVQWTPPENSSTPWSAPVTLQVSDGTATDTQSFSISVTPVNDAPIITSSAPTTATEETAYSYQLVVNDPDDAGAELTFSLTQSPAGMTISASGLIAWTPAEGVTEADVTASVADGGEDGAAAATQSWTISVTPVNDAPTITSVAPTTASENVEYQYQVAVSDADDSNNGTDLTFSLTVAPTGMTISSTGFITWTPENGVTDAAVTVSVSDGGEDGAAAATQSFTITVAASNDAPEITEGDSVDVSMDEDGSPVAFALQLNATDIDSATLLWSIQSAATQGSANVTGAGNSKVVTYTPTANYNGADSFVVRVSDGELSDDITVNVTINAVNDAPSITSTANLSATEGVLYQYTATAADVDSASLTWSLVNGPTGMSIGASSGVVSWTPADNGSSVWTENVSIQVSDGSLDATQNFTISVTPVDSAPEITEGASVSVTMSEDGAPTAFALTLNATDDDTAGASLTWSVSSAATNGLAVAFPTTGNSTAINYFANANYFGTDSFVISVSDGTTADSITVNVTVEAVNDAPVISTSAPLTADEGIAYQYDVNATDVENDTLTWSLTTAPSGMTINASTGVIDWLPGDGGSATWNAPVTVSVTDGSTATTQSFTISVTPELPVVGRVVKGVLANATVQASVYNAGAWNVIGTTTTNANGYFGFDLAPQAAPVRLRATTTVSTLMTCDAPLGCGAAAFGETFAPEVDVTLDTIVPGSQFAGPIAITPITNMAAQWVSDMPRGVNDDVILLAMRRVADLYGLNENFAYTRAVDVTVPAEVSAAAASDMDLVRHALFAASVQELAASQALTTSSANSGLAQMFSLLGGQMLLQTGSIDLAEYGLDTTDPTVNYNGLDLMVTSAQAVGAQVNVGGALDALLTSFDTLLTRWGDRIVSSLGEGTGYAAANFNRALAPLDEFDYYYNLAETAEAGINEVNRSVSWMYVDETAQTDTANLVTAMTEVLSNGFSAAICVPARRNSSSCDVESTFSVSITSCSAFSSTCKTTITGTVDGQTANVTIATTPDIRYLLGGANAFGSPGAYDNSNGITLCYNGTITNNTAVMTLTNFCVNPNLSNNNMDEFDSFTALNYTNESLLNPALENLIADLYVYVRVYGSAKIQSQALLDVGDGAGPKKLVYNMQNMDANVTFNRRVITQSESGPILTMNMKTLQRTNPAGETLFNLAGTDMFNLSLDDTSSLHIANGAVNVGLPEIRSITDATITGLAPLNDVITDYLLSMIDTTVPEPVVDWDQLQIDLQDAIPSGTSTLEVRDTTNKLYTFTLNADGTVDVSQVNSVANAMTIDLKGVAGYVYADDTLVSTGHLGNAEDGLLLSLVNDTQRTYPNSNPSTTAQLDGLVALFQALFPPAPDPAP